MDNNRKDPRKNPDGNGKRPKNIWVMILITVAIILIISSIFNAVSRSQYRETTYSDFLDAKANHQIVEAEVRMDRIVYLTKEESTKPASSQKASFTGLPRGDAMSLANELHEEGVIVNTEIVEDNSTIMMILYYVIMFGLIFAVMSSLSRRMSGEGMMGGMGKSRAKVYMEKQTGVTFQDVAGQDEAKESLQEIIDFLHNPG